MSKFILSSKSIGVAADGRYYEDAVLNVPGEGSRTMLVGVSNQYDIVELRNILADLGLDTNLTPADLAEQLTEDECLAVNWAISPKPYKCTEQEAAAFRLLPSPQCRYAESDRTGINPSTQLEVEAATAFRNLLGRLPNHSISITGIIAGEVRVAQGRKTERTRTTTAADPTKILSFKMRNLSDADLKRAVTAAGITVADTATPADVQTIAKANAAKVLEKI